MIITELLTVAKKLNNYALDATGGGLWSTTQIYKATVPTDKRWFLYGGVIKPDVSGTVTVALHDIADNDILLLASHAAGTAAVHYPESVNVGAIQFPIIMDAREYIRGFVGAVQSTAAYATCMVLEVDV